jgi:hypothetical protein
MGRQTLAGLRAKITPAIAARTRVPSGTPRRLLSSCSSADASVVVLGHHTHAAAPHLKAAMAPWLEEPRRLTPPPEKLGRTPGDDRCRCLGYDRRRQRHLNGTRWLRLSSPPAKARDVKAQTKRVCGSTPRPAHDLCMRLKAIVRGWTHDCRSANNATHRCLSLTGVVDWLTAHDLGRKPRAAIKRWRRTRSRMDPASGQRALDMMGVDGKRV